MSTCSQTCDWFVVHVHTDLRSNARRPVKTCIVVDDVHLGSLGMREQLRQARKSGLQHARFATEKSARPGWGSGGWVFLGCVCGKFYFVMGEKDMTRKLHPEMFLIVKGRKQKIVQDLGLTGPLISLDCIQSSQDSERPPRLVALPAQKTGPF